MFWSKFWLGLITLVCGAAVAVMLLVPRPLARELEREAGARLERAQHAAALLLKVTARKWMDTAAQVAADAVLVEALDQATRGPADLTLVHKTVKDRLRFFNERMKVDLVLATDARGRVIARAGVDDGVYKDGVEGLPLVADALRGYRGDDTWSLDGKLYRVAASPVIARDRYVGSLVVGQEVGKELAQSMKRELDVDVAFLLRGRVLAASTQGQVLSRLPGIYDQQAEAVARTGHTPPLSVDADEGRLVVLAPFIGEAAQHKAAYALILPRPGAAPLGALVAGILSQEHGELPWRLLAPVAGAALLALVLGVLLMRLEADRPLKRLAREAQALARGERHRLDDDNHPGKLGTVARALNTTLDRLGPAAGARPQPPSPSPAAPSLDSTLPVPATAASGGNLFNELSNPGPGIGRLPPSRADLEVARPELQRLEPPPPAPLPAPSVVERAHARDTDALTNPANGPDLIDAPGLLPPLSSTTLDDAPPTQRHLETPLPAPKPAYADTEEEEPTRTAPGGMRRDTEPVSTEEQELEAELQQVYRDFIETKERLGEPTEGVSLDKFLVKLKQNRTALIGRYNCKTVKFQVYVKDGKAALKATPVQS